MGFFISIIMLSILIFFHELGHFLVARFFGVRVEVFSIGFGKTIWSITKGGTEYALSLIPLGGYVKMKGQDDSNPNAKSDDIDSYNVKTPFQRFMILVAGSSFNIILAFFIFISVGLLGKNELIPVIGELNASFPAYKAGLLSGDEILEINDKKTRTWKMLNNAILQSDGEIKLLVLRKDKELEIFVQPIIRESKNLFGETISRPLIGITPLGVVRAVRIPLGEIIPFAFSETLEASKLILLGVQKLISGIVPHTEVGGIISIFKITSDASESGFVTLLLFTALISVNLGILNLLPIPALDGGHIIFVLYEMITKKVPSEAVFYRFTVFGWFLLGALMCLGIYNDINRWIING